MVTLIGQSALSF